MNRPKPNPVSTDQVPVEDIASRSTQDTTYIQNASNSSQESKNFVNPYSKEHYAKGARPKKTQRGGDVPKCLDIPVSTYKQSRSVTQKVTAGIYSEGHSKQIYHGSKVIVSGQELTDLVGKASEATTSGNPSADVTQSYVTAAGVAQYGGILVQKFYSSEPIAGESEQRCSRNRIANVLKIVHENTYRKTCVHIGKTFPADKFPKTTFEVHPQMAQSPQFYRGGHYVTTEKSFAHSRGKQANSTDQDFKKPQYIKDKKLAFSESDNIDNDFGIYSISFESLMVKIYERENEELDIMGVVAQAGAGKTTCLCRWARYIMKDNGMTRGNDFASTEESRFQLVHFVNMKDVGFYEDTTLQELLFQKLFQTRADIETAFGWVLQNDDKLVLLLDGLDQAQWKITEDDLNPVSPYERATTSNIFANLLTRHLLPRSRIIVSSREHSVTTLPNEARIKDIVTLTGFSREDAKKLFNWLTANNTAERISRTATTSVTTELIDQSVTTTTANSRQASTGVAVSTNWDKLATTSPALVPFISIPVFLMLTVIVFDTYEAAPSSITELLVKVFGTLQYTLNIREHERIWLIIDKLKKLSHSGMEKQLVIFSEYDLKNCELEVTDVHDLLLMVPKSRSVKHQIIRGRNVLFFSHQILQEFLSACYVVEMNLSRFKIFIQEQLNLDHWGVVRRFVYGLVFGEPSNEKLYQISQQSEKQNALRENLISQLKCSACYQPFDLFAAVYESNDVKLARSIREIRLGYIPLSEGAAHLLGTLLVRIRKLDRLILCNCPLTFDSGCFRAENSGNMKVDIKVVQTISTLQIDRRHFMNYFEHQCSSKCGSMTAPLITMPDITFGENYSRSIRIWVGALEVSLPTFTFDDLDEDSLSAIRTCKMNLCQKIMFIVDVCLHKHEEKLIRILRNHELGNSPSPPQYKVALYNSSIKLNNIGSVTVSRNEGLSRHCSELRIETDNAISYFWHHSITPNPYDSKYLRLLITYPVQLDVLLSLMKSLDIIEELWIKFRNFSLSESDVQKLHDEAEYRGILLRLDGLESPGAKAEDMIWQCIILIE